MSKKVMCVISAIALMSAAGLARVGIGAHHHIIVTYVNAVVLTNGRRRTIPGADQSSRVIVIQTTYLTHVVLASINRHGSRAQRRCTISTRLLAGFIIIASCSPNL